MNKHYYVARITDCGWFRLTKNCRNIAEAQDKLAELKSRYPNACVVVDQRVR